MSSVACWCLQNRATYILQEIRTLPYYTKVYIPFETNAGNYFFGMLAGNPKLLVKIWKNPLLKNDETRTMPQMELLDYEEPKDMIRSSHPFS
ncbi:hypothetical protein AND_001735 [Anopheles darlingi]|uniref:Uncharacterized protein n=1 Tax=Anopheles darlingi TaxID=43151 RepID=W5JT72_ANODA|nr:hypothetical protein AND_001735 [Anopheles darlingi]